VFFFEKNLKIHPHSGYINYALRIMHYAF